MIAQRQWPVASRKLTVVHSFAASQASSMSAGRHAASIFSVTTCGVRPVTIRGMRRGNASGGPRVLGIWVTVLAPASSFTWVGRGLLASLASCSLAPPAWVAGCRKLWAPRWYGKLAVALARGKRDGRRQEQEALTPGANAGERWGQSVVPNPAAKTRVTSFA